MADGGPLQLSLSGQQDLAEITSPDYPGERLIACRNPLLAADRARTRSELLAATEKLLAPVIARVQAGRLAGAGDIGVEAGKVIRAWAPLTFTDEQPPAPANPVAPARRSAAAQAKATRQHDETGRPCRSFRGLLNHLATLTRNQVRCAGATATIPMLTEPTPAQREAFHLIGAPIPLTLK
jgi:hypothetical protein